jgi:hypothetical protein
MPATSAFASSSPENAGFTNVDLLPGLPSERGTETVTDLVHHHHRQISLGTRLCGLIGAHHTLRQRQDHEVDARIHVVLEEDFLAADFLVNARIVRKIVGDRLISVTEIARAERRVHHFHRRLMTLLRRTIGRFERQRILNIGNIFLEHRQLFAFLLVADEHRGAVRGLHA